MVEFFQNGYNEAKLYTKSSDKRIIPKCPDCGRIKNQTVKISNIYHRKTIGCVCHDNIKYPEKYLINLLNQLNIKYIYQMNKSKYAWCKNYKFDFYLIEYDCIIETHGGQHYFDVFNKLTVEEQLMIDNLKKELAIKNNIKYYITLDCRYSYKEWIKNSIISSELNNLFNLNLINWDDCNEFATCNLVKKICDIKMNNPNYTPNDISKIVKLSREVVYKYLLKGNELGWCNYDPKYESMMSGKRTYEKTRNIHEINVGIYKDNKFLYKFNSYSELERKSIELFGVKLLRKYISAVCNNTREEYKGFTFKNL